MSFFKAYDMRGRYGRDFDLGTIRAIGEILPGVLGARRILVGHDARTTSPAIATTLIAAMEAQGAQVDFLGLVTTPMIYFFTAEEGYDASVMITASHNPPGDNGLKVSRKGALPVGYADGLNEIEVRIGSAAIENRKPKIENCGGSAASLPTPGSFRESRLERYIAWQKAAEPMENASSLRYAVDCSCGAAGIFARDLFPGAEIINDIPDGTFPAHSPNPLSAEARIEAAKLVKEKNLDLAIIFDGDADRVACIDEQGRFVQPDWLIPLVAEATLRRQGVRASATPVKIIHDVRTSRGAIEELRRDGFEPLMVPVGHVFAKKALRESGAECGGELAGHYYFREFHCCDSGVLAARRIIAAAARQKAAGGSFSALVAKSRGNYFSSGECNFKLKGGDKAAAAAAIVRALGDVCGEPLQTIKIDGLRLEYPDGWVSIRESNTEPLLRTVAEFTFPRKLSLVTATIERAIGGFAE